MGNTWSTVETHRSPTGVATIKVSETGKRVRVTFEDGSIDKKYDISDLPEYPRRLKTGKYFVALSNDKSEVIRIGPANSKPLTVCYVDMVRPEEGADPEPKEYENKEKHYTYQAFTVWLEVQEGFFKGCRIPKFLHYKFVDDGTGNAAFKGSPDRSPRLAELMEFMDFAGALDEPLEWDEDGNILPALHVRLKHAKRPFQVIIKKGYVESLLEDDGNFDDEPEDDDVDEAFPAVGDDDLDDEEEPVKPAKKSKVENDDLDDDLDDDDL